MSGKFDSDSAAFSGGAANEVVVPFPYELFEEVEAPTIHHLEFPVHALCRTGEATSTFELPIACKQCRLDLNSGEYVAVRDADADGKASQTAASLATAPVMSYSEANVTVDGNNIDSNKGSKANSFDSTPATNSDTRQQQEVLGTLHVHLSSRSAWADDAADGGDLTGFALFPETRELSQYLLDYRSFVQNQRVLEVGAGLALPSHVALACGATLPVNVTDGCASVLTCGDHPGLLTWPLLWREDSEVESGGGGIGEQSEENDQQQQQRQQQQQQQVAFDIVIGSGVAYATAALRPLFHTVRRMLRGRSENTNTTGTSTATNKDKTKGDRDSDTAKLSANVSRKGLFLCGFVERQVSFPALCAAAKEANFQLVWPGDDLEKTRAVPPSRQVDPMTKLGVYSFVLK